MKKYLFFLKPYLKETVWAGNRLKKHLKTSRKIGEAWLISAYKNAESVIDNLPLSEFYQKNPDFFKNYPKKIYPNLLKIIDAGQKLSLQVHPDDKMAQNFNSLGKDEAWFVIAESKNPFIIGAKSDNFISEIGKINKANLLNFTNLHNLARGDLAYISAGIIHSIPEGALVFEIQQNSDLTFRIYDFDRYDLNGKKRELHLDLAIKATKAKLKPLIVKKNTEKQQVLIKNKFFNLKRVSINSVFSLLPDSNVFWFEIIIISGEGRVEGFCFKTFDAILISGQIKKVIRFFAKNAIILVNEIRENNF
ncbi:mannose-6-phosphate isomerase [Mycoplasma flocculare]|uniref:type I phosphomannose isomerase catalytic subunit n=1 Tax=Mesomycoplasma flocculare TaxID=2128 RepID=UPI00136813BE|nr:type I phosphomannose isomerase catalytic subunit [Mesomycoplasma flocculare]MXR55873.1 mannose-6-phosphate isomerase [Mesomycoplasma flocculare]